MSCSTSSQRLDFCASGVAALSALRVEVFRWSLTASLLRNISEAVEDLGQPSSHGGEEPNKCLNLLPFGEVILWDVPHSSSKSPVRFSSSSWGVSQLRYSPVLCCGPSISHSSCSFSLLLGITPFKKFNKVYGQREQFPHD